MKAVTHRRILKVCGKMIFHEENEGNCYNFAGKTFSLKGCVSFVRKNEFTSKF